MSVATAAQIVTFRLGEDLFAADIFRMICRYAEGKRWIVMGREEKGTPKQIAKLAEEAESSHSNMLRC